MTDTKIRSISKRKKRFRPHEWTKNWELYIMLLLPITYIIIFKYIPIYGVQIAFRDYNVTKGISASDWVGMKHFIKFLESYNFWTIFSNTIILSFYQLIASFPMPILLALALNYCVNQKFKKTVQMITYAPHFISVVVLVGIMLQFLSPRYGMINIIIKFLGGEAKDFMGQESAFRHIYVWSGIWQGMGFGSIIYLAALSGIDPTLHEAAIVDGATKIQRIWHVDIPGIMPTAVILLILNAGRIMAIGFEKAYLLQNSINIDSSEIISTYVYKTGIQAQFPRFSFATAVGLFTSIISFLMLVFVNGVSRKLNETSLW